ncbi:universal stress protein [Spirosoma panaciterrae]|uniref:universal stress protein n=1 Tax=Spirosoma panaciterrae TaxID=496058 RepID=UPI0003631FBA|nr:universal stress protein [Spirosoma panaciterrae]
MKTILLATDFSTHEFWAADYACQLANQLRTHLAIVHAYTPITLAEMHGALGASVDQERFLAISQLSRMRTRMISATKGAIDASIIAFPGDAETAISTELARLKPDLLIMGLAGQNPEKARREGSLATKLIPQTQVPMLLVPPGARYQAIQNMILAVDLSAPIDALALAKAKRFAQLFGAALDIVCMEDEPGEPLQKAAEGIRKLLADQPHTFSFLPGNDLSIALDDFRVDHKADLIMMMPKPHTCFQTFLMESNTQHVARQSAVPVLAAV